MTSRREFLEQVALSTVGLSLTLPDIAKLGAKSGATAPAPRGFLDILRQPDVVAVQTATSDVRLTRAGDGRWTAEGIAITTAEQRDALHVELTAPSQSIKRIH